MLGSLTPEQQAAVELMTRGLMSKFLHLPLQALKSAARDGDAAALETIRGMFQRDIGGKTAEPDAANAEPGGDRQDEK
jgi:glutamyl-tRNA reductase